MFWWSVFMLIASYVITAAMTPKAQPPQAEALNQIDFPQVDEGTPQAVIFGDCWSADWTVLAVGNYRTKAIMKDDGAKF